MHAVLHLLSQQNTVSDQLEGCIIEQMPSKVHLNAFCTSVCMDGVTALCKMKSQNESSITLAIKNQHTLNGRFLEQLSQSRSIDAVQLFGCLDLRAALGCLKVGQKNSCIKKIVIFGGIINHTSPSPLPIGNEVTHIELRRIENLKTLLSLLEALRNKCLVSLKIKDCDLNDRCFQVISDLLQNPYLQHLALLSEKMPMQGFLSSISHHGLRGLEIDLLEMNEDEERELSYILQRGTLEKIRFRGALSHHLCVALVRNISNMTAVQDLHFKITRDPSMHD